MVKEQRYEVAWLGVYVCSLYFNVINENSIPNYNVCHYKQRPFSHSIPYHIPQLALLVVFLCLFSFEYFAPFDHHVD